MIVKFPAVAVIEGKEIPVLLELDISYAKRMNGLVEGTVMSEHGDTIGRFEQVLEKESDG